MREKLAIANQMRISRKNDSDNVEYRKICSKCYYTFIIECIIKGKNDFNISYGERFLKPFSKRLLDWIKYFWNIIYGFFLVHFTPGKHTLKKYLFIYGGVLKPFHLKIAEMPNETYLYEFLEKNGFKIKDKHVALNSIIYEIARA